MRYKVYDANDLNGRVAVIFGTSNEELLRPDEVLNGSVVLEIDTGRMAVKRAGNWEEISSGANVRTGVVNLGVNASVAVTFSRAFRGVPVVTVTPQFQVNDTSTTYSAFNVTNTGFTLNGAGNPAGNVGYTAVEL